ncbi:DUF805 domain-containing protein [Actinoallomurus sp. NPDC050550]|uniref:DUF805 domain-containing protein n=1 Tax=Actinoallomurus sp. NPDC050550 TaxID=3154937 RepID=UPI0033D07567
MSWYLAVLRNYAGFVGRARRTEYWMFVLFNVIITVVLDLIGMAVKLVSILGFVYGLAVLIPSIAVGVRRLHDTGRSGWWLLIGIIPIIGTIILIVFMATPGDRGDNTYGPDPKLEPQPTA